MIIYFLDADESGSCDSMATSAPESSKTQGLRLSNGECLEDFENPNDRKCQRLSQKNACMCEGMLGELGGRDLEEKRGGDYQTQGISALVTWEPPYEGKFLSKSLQRLWL